MALATVGHGTRSSEEVVAVVAGAGVRRLVDVRRYPASRRNPHLSREPLAATLAAAGVAYEWWGSELGGRRRPVPASRHRALRNDAFRGYADHMDGEVFRSALERLVGGSAVDPTVVMCAETLWWRCHRRLIADALVLRGVDVVHLVRPGTADGHVLHAAARAGEDGWPVYDVGVLPEVGESPAD